MFESAEIGHKIDKQTYKKEVPALRAALQDAQYDLKENGKIPVVVLVSGQDGAGKGETINILYEWMDPRFISTLAFSAPSDEERSRPFMWRYWRALPPKGRIGVFAGSWYSSPIHDRLDGGMSKADMDARIDQINRFEAMLVNEGALVLKFWFHLTKDGQKRRLKALEKDPKTAWRVTKWNWDRLKTYDKLQDVVGHVLRMSNTPWAPWTIIEGEDDRYRSLTTGKILLESIRQRLGSADKHTTPVAPPMRVNIDGRNVLSELNLKHALSEKDYEEQLAKWQGRLSELVRDPRFKGRALLCAFEGSDAAGKGGSIRRITGALDARSTRSFRWPRRPRRSAPSPTCGASGGTCRASAASPSSTAPGTAACWSNASKGFCPGGRLDARLCRDQRLRGSAGAQRCDRRQVLAGHHGQEEQLKRFKEREKTRFKRFKITEEDWRNRKKWDDYERHAVCDMIDRSSTEIAPWTLVEANDKGYARVKILRTICERLEAELEGHPAPRPKPEKPAKEAKAKKSAKPAKLAATPEKGKAIAATPNPARSRPSPRTPRVRPLP
jgi:polyphosphate kinase 2 (PPK2 family)